MGVADGLRMRKLNNGQKVNFTEIDAGGGPETGILLVVALSVQCESALSSGPLATPFT